MSRARVIRAIDVCGGAGGWACAAQGLPVEIVYTIDKWDVCCRTYKLNHPGIEVVQGDIRDKDVRHEIVRRFRGIDLVLGAVPCKWLSVYRNIWIVEPDELAAERATLKAVLDLVKAIDPRYWCLEDVIQLRDELPDGTPYEIINSERYSPQKRRRLFAGVFPTPAPGSCRDVMSGRLRPGPYRIGRRAEPRRVVKHRKGFDTVVGWMPGEKAHTVISISSRHDSEFVIVDDGLPGGKRQMEWQEAAGLQGFPESYIFYGSPTDVGEMVGQAVQIDTGRAILEAIVEEWRTGKKGEKGRSGKSVKSAS